LRTFLFSLRLNALSHFPWMVTHGQPSIVPHRRPFRAGRTPMFVISYEPLELCALQRADDADSIG
jgi:hypothetical protein